MSGRPTARCRCSRVCVNAKREPSGEKPIQVKAGVGGSVTLRSAPSAMVFSTMDRASWARCGPLVRGLIRRPAQPQHRLRDLGNRRHARALDQRDEVSRRTHLNGRRRRRIEDVDDDFGRQLIAGCSRRRRLRGDPGCRSGKRTTNASTKFLRMARSLSAEGLILPRTLTLDVPGCERSGSRF